MAIYPADIIIHKKKVHRLYQIIFNVTAVETQDKKKRHAHHNTHFIT
jgi:hypothetical protein